MTYLGTRQPRILEVYNDTTSEIPKGKFVMWKTSVDAATALTEGAVYIGGSPETIAGSYDLGAPAEPTIKVEPADANNTKTIGVTLGPIPPGARGHICVEGLCEVQTDGGADVDAGVKVGPDANGRADAGATLELAMCLADSANHATAGDLAWCAVACWTHTAGFGGS